MLIVSQISEMKLVMSVTSCIQTGTLNPIRLNKIGLIKRRILCI